MNTAEERQMISLMYPGIEDPFINCITVEKETNPAYFQELSNKIYLKVL
jgi:hypothetical protein